MTDATVLAARQAEAIGSEVILRGWVRTRRDSKGGFSFVEINDGTCLSNIQIVVDGDLPNYESEVKKLTAGCSVYVRGEVKPSGGKGQSTEVHAAELRVLG
ncbi:OB-fold nucleic acid binding domain-containing protein, partial [Pirellulales bacterium]|nr:OB-fold nucleic acid binding domain-containing protein [Pirellulales bacterium]